MCYALKKKKKRILFSKTGRRSLSQPTAEAGLACPARSPAPAPALRPWLPRGGRTPATPAGWRPVAPAPLLPRLPPSRRIRLPCSLSFLPTELVVAEHVHACLRHRQPLHPAPSTASISCIPCSPRLAVVRPRQRKLLAGARPSSSESSAPWTPPLRSTFPLILEHILFASAPRCWSTPFRVVSWPEMAGHRASAPPLRHCRR
jgi:hypothetical protein